MKKNSIYKLILFLFLAFLILPLGVVIIWSFTKSWPWPNLLPETFGMRGWKYFFDPSSKSIKILFNSIGLSLIVTIITVLISIPAGKALGVYKFKGKKAIEMLIFAPIIVPTVAVAMGIHLSFLKLDLANRALGVILIHTIPCIPYAVRILQNVFEIVGEELELQARVLGASKFKAFIYITLPIIMPGILSAGSLVFIVSFSQYFLTFLIGGGSIVSFSMLMFPFIQSGDRMVGSVYSIVFIVSTLVCLFLMEFGLKKFYKEGNFFYN